MTIQKDQYLGVKGIPKTVLAISTLKAFLLVTGGLKGRILLFHIHLDMDYPILILSIQELQ